MTGARDVKATGLQAATLTAAVEAATLAPSVHNTQPWLFRIDADRIDLFADLSRQLSVTDPTGRQLHLSCGAALHHLTVSLRAADLRTDVQLFPAGPGNHLASVAVSPAEDADLEQHALAAAILERHSQREPFAGHGVHHENLAELRMAAEAHGGWLAVLERREDQITLAVLQGQADQTEVASSAYRAELANWRRAQPCVDGISSSAMARAHAGRHSEIVIRDYAIGQTDLRRSDSAGHPREVLVRDERPSLIILGSDADTPEQWLTAGKALSHVLLKATMLGLRASMLGQVIDLPGTRAQLRRRLRLTGKPQMVLRVGYGPAAQPSPRRPLADVLL